MGMFNYVFLFWFVGVPELEICLRRPPATRKLEKLVKTTKSSCYFSFLDFSLGAKSKNLILCVLLVFLVSELPGATGDKSRALELQKPPKKENVIKHPH